MRTLALGFVACLAFCLECSTEGGDGAAEDTVVACGDGIDNDGDGFTDCADQDCGVFVLCAGADADADADADDGGGGCLLENFVPDPLEWIGEPWHGLDGTLAAGGGEFLGRSGSDDVFQAAVDTAFIPIDTDVVLTTDNYQRANVVLLHNVRWSDPGGWLSDIGLVSTGGTLRFTRACAEGIAGTLSGSEFREVSSWVDGFPTALKPGGCTLRVPGLIAFDIGDPCPGPCDSAVCTEDCIAVGHTAGECRDGLCFCTDTPVCNQAACAANSAVCGCRAPSRCVWNSVTRTPHCASGADAGADADGDAID